MCVLPLLLLILVSLLASASVLLVGFTPGLVLSSHAIVGFQHTVRAKHQIILWLICHACV